MCISPRTRLFLAVALFGLVGCGLLEGDDPDTEVTKEVEIPLDYTIDADEVCRKADTNKIDCDQQNQDIPEDQFPIPLGEYEVDQNVDVVQRTGRTELRDLSGRFKRITISKIDYKVVDDDNSNTLSISIPEIDVHVGPKKATSRNDSEYEDQIVRLATLPRVPPGKTPDQTVDVSDAAQNRASPLFKQLEFSAIPYGEPKVRGNDELPPEGKADLELTIHAKFVADPVDEASN